MNNVAAATPIALEDAFYDLLAGGAKYLLLLSALDLQLPALLSGRAVPADEIVASLQLEPHRGRKWLHALKLTGLIVDTGSGYSNSPNVEALFGPYSGGWFHNEFVRYFRYSASQELVGVLRGGPVGYEVRYPPQDWNDVVLLHEWMRNTAISTLFTIERHVDFRQVSKLLDVGGGDGTMATILATRYPNLSITVFNIPAAVALTESRIAEAGVTGRVNTVAGDFRTNDPFPQGYDMVMFSRVMADWPPEVCRSLMLKSKEALNPQGKLVICEPLSDQNEALAVAWEHSYIPYDDFGLCCYKPLSMYEKMLREAGFHIMDIAPRDASTIHCVIVSERD
ncbi:MAG TPA: methyltransferase [Bryobacteraceae bacterium]|nr:methyltransferase [Bryobacteraceae bacterium]